ncbi:MAG: hypothetical protein OSB41_03030 [Kiritimatiellae bacterium]|nr:hypothetical protein [Kiritimatiellia bacterium]
MHVAVILNDRSFREALVNTLHASGGHTAQAFATAAAALINLTAKPFDLIALDAVTFPGFGAGDSHINDLAALIPKADYNETLLYWEVTLRLIDCIRAEGSANVETPIAVRVSNALPASIGMGDVLSKEAVRKDLSRRAQVHGISSSSPEAFGEGMCRLD